MIRKKQWLWFGLLYLGGVSVVFGIALLGKFLLSLA